MECGFVKGRYCFFVDKELNKKGNVVFCGRWEWWFCNMLVNWWVQCFDGCWLVFVWLDGMVVGVGLDLVNWVVSLCLVVELGGVNCIIVLVYDLCECV